MDMKETKNNSPELTQNSVATSDADNTATLNPVINNKIDAENANNSQDKFSDIGSPVESENSPKSNKIPLIIRCPFTTTDLNIYIDPSHNVLHLKKKIYKGFPSNPKPSDQRLIFGGRIINNDEILSDVLKRQMNDLSSPLIIHLIINSLAKQHSKTVKPPTSSNNSENLSTNNTSSSSIPTSPVVPKQNVNENYETMNVSSSSVTETNVKEVKQSTIDSSKTAEPVPTTTTSDVINTTCTTNENSSNVIQYVLINNIIYAVQVAPTLTIPLTQPSLAISSDLESTTRAEDALDNNNNNDNVQPAADNNANNAQQDILNQIINENDNQQQQPNQFFLLIRLALIVYLLTQGGGYIRMFIVTVIAIIIFLVQTGRITVTIINYRNLPGVNGNNNNNNENQNEHANNNNNNEINDNNRNVNNENEPLLNDDNNNDGNNNNNNNNNNPENVVPQYSFLTNCRRVFFAFFLSLIPFIQDIA